VLKAKRKVMCRVCGRRRYDLHVSPQAREIRAKPNTSDINAHLQGTNSLLILLAQRANEVSEPELVCEIGPERAS